MHRTSNAFTVLQAIAATVAIAIFLWSVGLPSLRFAEAASVTSYSNTLSTSEPSVVSNHTIEFTTPTGVANGQTITIDFSDGPFIIGSVDHTDIDVATTSDYTLAGDCLGSDEIGAVFAAEVLTLTFCGSGGASIPANGTTTIEIGLNATFDVAGDAQLVNPAVGTYQIPLTAGASDLGETIVAITPTVLVTATVDTYFTFSVDGLAGGQSVNGETTGGTTTATEIPFGVLNSGTASTAAQELTVLTNARNGFVVTVETDQQLTSGLADIDSYRNGNDEVTPVPWEGPTPDISDENTWGHWGLTSNDATLTDSLTDPFNVGSGGDRFAAILTTPVEVFRHTGPTDGSGQGEGTTRVGYKVEISALQEASNDYTATLTYVATPVF